MAGPRACEAAEKVGAGVGELVAAGLAGADFFAPTFKEQAGIAVVMEFAAFGGPFDVEDHAVMDDVMAETTLGHAEAEVYVFATVDVGFVEAFELEKEIPAAGAAGGGDGAPFADLAFVGAMKEALAVVSGVALRGEDDAGVVEAAVADEFLRVADHADLFPAFVEDGEHGAEPVALDEDVVVEEAKVFTSGFAGGEVVVDGVAFAFVVEKGPVGRSKGAKEGWGVVGAAIVHEDDFVGEPARECPFHGFETASSMGELPVGRDEEADFGRNAHRSQA